MFRLRKLVKYLHKNRKEGDYGAVRLEHELFFNTWLYEKWYITILHRMLLKSPFKYYHEVYRSPNTERGKYYEEERHQKLRDLIEKAKEKGFIEPVSMKYFQVTRQGRQFLGLLHFIEETSREFGYTASIFATIITTAIISICSTLLVFG